MFQNENENETVINATVDQMMSNFPLGSVARALSNNLYGINLRQTGNAVPRAKDSQGFVFFTRPQLNLTQMNVTRFRGFYNLLNSNKTSYQHYTRLMLDPKLAVLGGHQCPFVDNENVFIPILTNNILSLSGWPDITVPTYTSESGLMGEEHSIVDGVTNNYEAYDLDVTFRNIKGSPLLYFFYIWIKYQTLVFEGVLDPYLDMIVENEIDYNTRIYRIVLDQQKRYVTYIGATGASYPLNVPLGNLFDFNSDTPYNTKNAELNIRFKCMGFIAFEDLMKLHFNKASAIFNSNIRELLKADLAGNDESVAREDPTKMYTVSGCNLVKIPYALAMSSDGSLFDNPFYSVNHKAYPYINLVTNELEWWIDKKYLKDSAEKSFKKDIEDSGLGNNDDMTG